MELIIIAAIAKNNAIGKNNDLIWHLPNDLKRFKKVTLGYPIIMGRKTFDSLGAKPLPKRLNIVISSQEKLADDSGLLFVKSLEEAINKATFYGKEKAYILGGGQIFESAIKIADRLDITKVDETFVGDVFFPEINTDEWVLESEEKHMADEQNLYNYSFCSYKRK